MKKYLITGGAGFIGSHLSGALLRSGNEVVIIDDFSANAIEKIDSKIKIYKIGIENTDRIKEIFKKEKPDIVYHLAGVINLRRQIADPLFAKDLDFLRRTETILDACRKNSVKKIIFISSGGAIYENARVIPTPQDYPVHPASLYGLANLMLEKYIQSYCKEREMDFIILRLSNVYGPRQWISGIVPSLIIKFLKKERPIIYGDGRQTRDFIYIDDAIRAFIIAAEKTKTGVYNIGSGKEVNLNKLFELLKDIFGLKIESAYQDLKGRESKRSALSIEKIKKEFGWQPQTNLKDGLSKTIKWFQKNERN